jgi:hypothetical protein
VSLRGKFDKPAARRREIERFARHIDVADSDDFRIFLIAWQWHNPNSKDAIGALMMAAKRMGGAITEEQAEQIIEEADIIPKRRTADALGRWLRLSDAMRTFLKIRTIGSFDVSSRQRAMRRKERNRACKEMKRRAAGSKSRGEYLAAARSKTQPWKLEGKSRSLWYSHRKSAGQVRVHSPLSPSWTGPGTLYCSKTAPDLSKLTDRKEMAKGVTAPKHEHKTLSPRLCKGALAVPGPVLRRNRMKRRKHEAAE